VFEKVVLKKIFGPKREEVTAGRGSEEIVYNAELRNLYSSLDIKYIKTIKSNITR
jgi:hypothetical protein